jgi:uncharacterized membrane protein YhaH (DUF805 family)
MEFISKLEKLVLGWAKNVPHLPAAGQKWLGANVWWIALIGAIISGIATLISLGAIATLVGTLSAPSNAYYVASDYTSLAIMTAIVSLVFLVANGVLLALAVKPLQNMQKKGWVLLFLTLLVQVVSVLVRAVLTFSIVGFIVGIIFGAVGLAITAYFLSEIHGQFSHRAKVTIRKA